MQQKIRPTTDSVLSAPPQLLAACVWASAALWATHAAAQTLPEPRNVVQLQASAQREVVQDWLTVVLAARHQASDAATVQNQLKATLEQALQKARAAARPGEV
jgi:predicted secreted protein